MKVLWRALLLISTSSLFISLSIVQGQAETPDKEETFLGQYPELEKLTYKEPPSGIYFGLGVTPFGLFGSKYGAGVSAFQFHYITQRIDWEVLNGGFLFAFGNSAASRSNYFTLRSAPKWRISKLFSAGPLVGYEVVSFPNVKVTLTNDKLTTPEEPFSSRGFVYGIECSETFELASGSLLKINQVIFQETYKNTRTAENWKYSYKSATDKKTVEASYVFGLEVSYLF